MIEPVEAGLGRSAHFRRVIKAMSETAIQDETTLDAAILKSAVQFICICSFGLNL